MLANPAKSSCSHLEISVDDKSTVHVLETEDDLGAVEADFGLGEDAVLRQMVVQVAAVHQIENEAQLLGRLKCVRHAHDERRAFLRPTNTTPFNSRICRLRTFIFSKGY